MEKIVTCGAILITLLFASPGLAQEKKAKPLKVTGDIGLLDLEKNYIIVVTKEGKLVTVDFDKKTKVTKYMPEKTKMSDIGLGQEATITYKPQGEKNVIDSVEVKVKAKKGE